MNCSLNYQKIIHKYIDFQPYIVTCLLYTSDAADEL